MTLPSELGRPLTTTGSPKMTTRNRDERCLLGYFDRMSARVHNAWFSVRDEESGQTLIEYVLIVTLIALAAIAALGFLSGKIQAQFSDTGNSL